MSETNEESVENPVEPVVMQYEHIFWLVAQDVVFLFTTKPEDNDGLTGWTTAINCNDTFYYATADAEELSPKDISKAKDFFDRYGWAGLVAMASDLRGQEPLKQLQTDEYLAAKKELAA